MNFRVKDIIVIVLDEGDNAMDLREALEELVRRLRNTSIPFGRDEHTFEYAQAYEEASETAADQIEAILREAE